MEQYAGVCAPRQVVVVEKTHCEFMYNVHQRGEFIRWVAWRTGKGEVQVMPCYPRY